MEIIDISVSVYDGMKVFPGDPTVAVLPHSRIARGDVANVSELHMGTHTGTHMDPPLHFFIEGMDVSHISLKRLIGECYVLDMESIEKKITREELYPKRSLFKNKILLLKTGNSRLLEDEKFHTDYVYLTKDGAELLVKQKVKLVGIDYLSIEEYGGSGEVHRTLLGSGTPVIETLNMSGIEEGEYFFTFLPLKIKGGDGGPGRAVLIKKEE
ncbi:kynurenine formamidase [archaeon]|nr:kynurenine formamidase [archaeon]